jgi:Flp pilus assembly protein TadG
MRPPNCPERVRQVDRGSATVEVAIAMPVIMLLLMLVVQAGVYFHTRAVVTTAAHKAADAVRVDEGSIPAGQAAADAFLDRNAPALDDRSVEVVRTADRAEVTVSGNVVSLVFGLDLFPVSVSVSAPIERVTP